MPIIPKRFKLLLRISKTLSTKAIGILAAAGSAALLSGAFLFQSLGYAPCAMCIWQRYPHVLAIAAGALLVLGLRHPLIFGLGALAAATTAGLGAYHTGVERDWWEGPTSCTGSGLHLSNMSVESLLPTATDQSSGLVLCDEVVWEFLSFSMASWNAILSAILTVIWVLAFLRSFKARHAQ